VNGSLLGRALFAALIVVCVLLACEFFAPGLLQMFIRLAVLVRGAA